MALGLARLCAPSRVSLRSTRATSHPLWYSRARNPRAARGFGGRDGKCAVHSRSISARDSRQALSGRRDRAPITAGRMDRAGSADAVRRAKGEPHHSERSARHRQPDIHARDPHERFMRIRLYLFESLYYYDFLFRTANGQTQWWWLISEPGDRNGPPANSFGPFATRVSVPPRDFLAGNSFSHAGSWSVLGRSCEAFSARRSIKPATWFWFEFQFSERITSSICRRSSIPHLHHCGMSTNNVQRRPAAGHLPARW
jgi:hypothetical protein